MGNIFGDAWDNVGAPLADAATLGLTGFQKKKTGKDYQNAMDEAMAGIHPAYEKAGTQLQTGYDTATGTAKTGFQNAINQEQTGYNAAHNELTSGTNTAIGTAKGGFEEANKAYNENPAMVSSRAEIYNRILGKGGMNDQTLNAQAGKVREEYGTGLRGAADTLKTQFGDAGGKGIAAENLARAASSLGGQRANAIRDINVQNEYLKRQEMTDAMKYAQADAFTQAGLKKDEAVYISGMEQKLAEGGASLTSQEAGALSQLAAQEGTTLAGLQERLKTGQANLTTEEAKAIVEIMTAKATGQANISQSKSGLLF